MIKKIITLFLALFLNCNFVQAELTTAVARNTTPTTTGTVDFTVADFGTPTAAMFFLSYATTDGTLREATYFRSIGFTDGTNDRCVAGGSQDGAGTSVTGRSSSDAFCVMQCNEESGASDKTGAFNSWITNGVRLDWTVTTGSAAMTIVCVLFKGTSDVTVGTITPNATENGTAAISSLSYEPDFIFFGCNGDDIAAGGSANNVFSFGCAANEASINQRATFGYDEDAQGTMDSGVYVSTNRCCGQFFNGSVSWSAELTAFAANGFTITTRGGATGSDDMIYFAIGSSGISFDLQTIDSTTTATTKKYSTSFQTDAIIGNMTFASAIDTAEGTDRNVSFAASNGDGEYSIGGASLNGASTSDTYNITNAKVVDFNYGASWADSLIADVDSYDSDGITFNWTDVDGSARYGWALILGGAPPAATFTPKMMMF